MKNSERPSKSTGPKTAHGKSHSSKNAVKNGLLARQILHNEAIDPGSKADFKDLLEQLNRTYQPVTVDERLQVELIASLWWRRARIWRYEVVESTRLLLPADLQTVDARWLPADLLANPKLSISRLNVELETLELLRKEISDTGTAKQSTLELLARMQEGDTVAQLLLVMLKKRILYPSHEPEPDSPAVEASIRFRQSQTTAGALEKVDEGENSWSRVITEARRRELLVQQVDALIQPRMIHRQIAIASLAITASAERRVVLPEETACDRILRYANATEKQLYRALEELRHMISFRLASQPRAGSCQGPRMGQVG